MYRTIALGFIALLLFTTCSDDMRDVSDNVPQYGLQHMEFTASTGIETRTELTNDNNVFWLAGDEISIFDGRGNRKFTTNKYGASAVFGGNAAKSGTYYALYPYSEGATLSGNVIKNVTLPSEQTAKAGSFDAAYNFSVATASSDLQLSFKNVGSLVRFSVSNDQASKVRKVKLTSYDDTVDLTGTFDITLGEKPVATPTSGQQPSATLIADSGLKAGKYYYFSVLPSVLSSGFSLTFYDDEDKIWQKDYPNEENLVRSSIQKLAPIKVGTFMNSLLTNTNLIAAVEAETRKTFTKNADGSVSLSNADNYQIVMSVTLLDISGKGDPSICESIGLFNNLELLYCSENGITNLDLSNNTKLILLSCDNNQLSSLDLSNNTQLIQLYCNNNQLSNLDLSNNTKLNKLSCDNNQLSNLDLSKNTELDMLSCHSNQLTSLNLSNNNSIFPWIGRVVIGNQTDGANNEQVLTLYVNPDQYQYAQILSTRNGANKNIIVLSTSLTNRNLIAAAEEATGKTFTKNVDGSISLFNGDNYQIVMSVTSLDISRKGVSSICEEIGHFRNLQILNCSWNGITNLDLSGNTALKTLICDSNRLSKLNLSKNTELEYLSCESNQLTSLDVSKNTKLNELYCLGNQLTNLDVSKNTTLKTLICHHNQLISLDVSKNTELELLNCSNNQLTSLDVSMNTALEFLECIYNQLKSLHLLWNTNLVYLSCANNQLTSLDISLNTALEFLECTDNFLTTLDISSNYNLGNILVGHQWRSSRPKNSNDYYLYYATLTLFINSNQIESVQNNPSIGVHVKCVVI